MIDPGHGGYDNGAQYNGRKEKDDNLRLALAVGQLLQEDGYDVEYTRTTDVYDSPIEKARIANASGADYFVSFHRNSSENPNTYSGVETLVYDDSGIKAEVARNVNAELEKAGFKNLGITARPNLIVLRRTQMPAILIEAGFINNDKDNALFDNNFSEISRAIATGIEDTISGARAQSIEEKASGNTYSVQIGNFSSIEEARQFESKFFNDGYETTIVN